MSRSFRRLAVTLLAFGFAVPSSLAQKIKRNDQDPMSKPRNEKVEVKKAYKDWLEKDVAYIITDEERKAFRKLETDDERWAVRAAFSVNQAGAGYLGGTSRSLTVRVT